MDTWTIEQYTQTRFNVVLARSSTSTIRTHTLSSPASNSTHHELEPDVGRSDIWLRVAGKST